MGQLPIPMKTASRIFFGTANPPVSTDEKTAYDLLDTVFASGVNAFDCARSYGKAEEVLGKWIESRKCREKTIILSKCGYVKAGKVLVNRRVIMEQLNQSLESLRTNCIDIYLLHRDNPNTSAEELADKYGVSVPEIAMRYVFSNEMYIFAVVSTTSAERLQMNIHAANSPLSSEDAAYLEA